MFQKAQIKLWIRSNRHKFIQVIEVLHQFSIVILAAIHDCQSHTEQQAKVVIPRSKTMSQHPAYKLGMDLIMDRVEKGLEVIVSSISDDLWHCRLSVKSR